MTVRRAIYGILLWAAIILMCIFAAAVGAVLGEERHGEKRKEKSH